MNNVDLISEELWDHYIDLPNPAWYQYPKKLNDEEDSTKDITDLGNSNVWCYTKEAIISTKVDAEYKISI